MGNPRATIGGNNPPDPLGMVLEPFNDVLDEAQNWLDGGLVENDGQLTATNAILKDVKAALKAVSGARDSVTKPLHQTWKDEIAKWKPAQDDLSLIIKGLVAAQDPYKRKLAEQKEAEKRAAWDAADRAKKEAEQAAKNARPSDVNAQRAAIEMAETAMDLRAAASDKQKDTVKGMRTVHKYSILNHRTVLHWIAKNDKDAVTEFIEAYAKKHHRDKPIDGLDTWTEKEAF